VIPGRGAAELVKYVHNRPNGPESLKRGRSVEQAYHLPPAADGRYALTAVAYGPSIELNVNRRLVLDRFTMPRRRGSVGLFVEDGAAAVSHITVQPLTSPACHWD
jgi:hypothetical protein